MAGAVSARSIGALLRNRLVVCPSSLGFIWTSRTSWGLRGDGRSGVACLAVETAPAPLIAPHTSEVPAEWPPGRVLPRDRSACVLGHAPEMQRRPTLRFPRVQHSHLLAWVLLPSSKTRRMPRNSVLPRTAFGNKKRVKCRNTIEMSSLCLRSSRELFGHGWPVGGRQGLVRSGSFAPSPR